MVRLTLFPNAVKDLAVLLAGERRSVLILCEDVSPSEERTIIWEHHVVDVRVHIPNADDDWTRFISGTGSRTTR